jgi:thiamine biosynthesis lipoprotein
MARRKVKKIVPGLTLVLIVVRAFSLVCAGTVDNATLMDETRQMLHTAVQIKAWGENAGPAMAEAFAEMDRVNTLLNNYDNASEISAINRNAGGKAVPVSPETMELLKAADTYGRLSGGAHDVTVGPLVKLWGFAKEKPGLQGAQPTAVQIRKAKELVDYRSVELVDRVENGIPVHTARLAKTGMWIDMGSISKGYCADRAIAVLKKYGIPGALVAAGGTICTIGHKPDGSPWKVAVRHPRKDDDFMTFVPLVDASISTSGDYERFYKNNGKRLGHIINPRTGRPVERMQSVSVIAKTGLETDSLDTTLFVLGAKKAAALIDKLPSAAALMITGDGTVVRTQRWPESVYIKY